jgi:hypothetical protein
MHSEGKLMIGLMVIEEAKSFYDEIEVIDKCIFSEGSIKTVLPRV